jgi:L-ascorbate metabolism protein UlaG (beta-lactamase superfamily)
MRPCASLHACSWNPRSTARRGRGTRPGARLLTALLACLLYGTRAGAAADFESDVIPTAKGDLEVTFIGHGTLLFQVAGKVIHVDPVSRYADYSKLPKADLILVTHEHGDHFDPEAIAAVSTPATTLILTQACHDKLQKGVVLKNGEHQQVLGFTIEAVPAYNVVHMRPEGVPFHPKGAGNGYIITVAKTRIYVAGDTENTPEMKQLQHIDCAFLPMNLPYTMTPEMVADAARAFRPRILYPYHFGKTDPATLVKLLADDKEIEVRIRRLE